MSSYLSQAGAFIISTIIGLYIIAVLLRFLLQWTRADFYNPMSQFLVKVTNPLLIPLRRVIPGLFGLDMASLVLAYLLQVLELFLLSLLVMDGKLLILTILWVSIGKIISLFLYIYLFAIVIQAIISWINPGNYNPMTKLIGQITEPVLRPARKLLPPFSGMDLSPLLVLIIINLLIMMVPFIF